MRLGVIGWPIAHSRSPAMQSAALSALGLPWTYEAHAVAPPDLAHFLATATFRGLNVTIPHKEAAYHLCEPDALARQVGAVNTLLFDGKRPRGFNTDVHGFQTWATEERAIVPGGTALLLGSGGAARAVALALHAQMRLTILSRTPRPFTLGDITIPTASYESLATLSAHAELLIDATPRGLDPLRATTRPHASSTARDGPRPRRRPRNAAHPRRASARPPRLDRHGDAAPPRRPRPRAVDEPTRADRSHARCAPRLALTGRGARSSSAAAPKTAAHDDDAVVASSG